MHHDEDPAASAPASVGDDDTGGNEVHTSSEDCLALCAQCGLDELVGEHNCDEFCTDVGAQAADAGCGDLYGDLVRCRAKSANACSLTACPSPTNAFSVCVLTYCDDHPFRTPLCTAW